MLPYSLHPSPHSWRCLYQHVGGLELKRNKFKMFSAFSLYLFLALTLSFPRLISPANCVCLCVLVFVYTVCVCMCDAIRERHSMLHVNQPRHKCQFLCRRTSGLWWNYDSRRLMAEQIKKKRRCRLDFCVHTLKDGVDFPLTARARQHSKSG